MKRKASILFIKSMHRIKRIIDRMFSLYVSSELKSCGSNLLVEYPIDFLNAQNISIGDNFTARVHCKIRAYLHFADEFYNPFINIGSNVYFGTNCYLGAIGQILIGNNVTVASRVTIVDHTHGRLDFSDIEVPVMSRVLSSKGPIVIEDNVWIGENAVILSGLRIGKNSIIGANSVVTKDIPSYCIAGGTPAKLIKQIPH